MPRKCYDCGETASKQCAGCKKAWYCSEKCQRSNWKRHIFDCKRDPSKPIITAYRLYLAVIRDILPDDEETCEDYGFTRAHSFPNQTKLFGLYIALLKFHEVEPIALHRWRKQGILIQEIKKFFENLTPLTRGQYYPWFLENQYILDPSWQPLQDPVFDEVMKIWRFVNAPAVDSIEEFRKIHGSWEPSKRSCFTLYHSVLIGGLPNYRQDEWVTFGFAACPNQHCESLLLRSYSTIIIDGKCPLDEFTRKFKAGRLIALFQRCKMQDQVLGIPYMKDFLEDSSSINSVWWLKAYVYQDPGQEDMHPAVGVDYGINNCRGVGEFIALVKDTYKKVFDHPQSDHLELHKACITGQIYPYVDSLLKLKKKDAKFLKRLLQNPYPLPDL
ncbi:hypothetical protein M408DRAFT_331864 [Serendipita vermifera MAFF 305830]|uniref:MYND-type domain-containing protein n=1 Tax=Serendipita vermifera MAFF 305830 TaxID=933852 RepID=A0A0C3AHU7_SERVB|nr:hypothetical protein M408DRAFT_331864 [Serendipita vermifera MAFF 305830]